MKILFFEYQTTESKFKSLSYRHNDRMALDEGANFTRQPGPRRRCCHLSDEARRRWAEPNWAEPNWAGLQRITVAAVIGWNELSACHSELKK